MIPHHHLRAFTLIWIVSAVVAVQSRADPQAASRPAGAASASNSATAGAVVNGVRLEAAVTSSAIVSDDTITASVDVVNEGHEPVRFFRPLHADMTGKRNWRLIRSDGTMFMPWWTTFQSEAPDKGVIGDILDIPPGKRSRLMQARVELVQPTVSGPRGFGWARSGDPDLPSEFPVPIPPGDYRLTFSMEKLDQTVPFLNRELQQKHIEGLWTGSIKSNPFRLHVAARTKPFIQVSGPAQAENNDVITVVVENPTPQPLRLRGAFTLSLWRMPSTQAESRFRIDPTVSSLAENETFVLDVPANGTLKREVDVGKLPLRFLTRYNSRASRVEQMGGAIVSLAEFGSGERCGIAFVGQDGRGLMQSPPFSVGNRRSSATSRPSASAGHR